MFDLEAQAIETNDFDGAQGGIRAHQQASSPCGMNDGDKTDEQPRWTPQQIKNTIAKSDVAFAVNWTGNLLHRSGICKQGLELYFLAIGLGSPPFVAAFPWRGGRVGNRIGLNPAHQMMALFEQAAHDLARGVVGIGDKVIRNRDGQDIEQAEHLVEQGAAVTIGPYQTFVDTRGERYAEEALSRVDEQADRLQRMAHDVLGLGVRFRLLMQQLYGRHFPAAFGDFDAIPDQDQPAIDAQRTWEQPQHCRPQGRQPNAGSALSASQSLPSG